MIREISITDIKNQIRNVPDFPKPGIQFKDITTILQQPDTFNYLVDTIASHFLNKAITKVVCIESRGFILGGALAYKLGAGFVPIRKPGKLPSKTYSREYLLEYGKDRVEIHTDALADGDVVLLHDDLLATGGTTLAATNLLNNFNLKKVYINFLCELDFLNGRKRLDKYEVSSLIHY